MSNTKVVETLFDEVKKELMIGIKKVIPGTTRKDVIRRGNILLAVSGTTLKVVPSRTGRTNAFITTGTKPELTFHSVHYPEHVIKLILVHEFMHVISDLYYNKNTHHSALFKNLGARFGYPKSNFNATRPVPEGIEPRKIKYKYIIKCKHCGSVSYYARKSQVVKMVLGEIKGKLTCCHCDSHDFEITMQD